MISIFRSSRSKQKEWESKTIEYARSINRFVATGLRDGWKAAGDEPPDIAREHLVPELIRSIRRANSSGDLSKLRKEWPLAHSPLIPHLEQNGTSIPVLALLDDGSIAARLGAPYQQGKVILIRDRDISDVPGVSFFGKCPNGRFFAYANEKSIWITDGWLGQDVAQFDYPKGTEGIPDGYRVSEYNEPPIPTSLIPFPDGQRLLFISASGIFVLSTRGISRLLPTTEDLKDHFDWLQEEYPEDELSLDIDMEHGAISPNGKFIAIGSQDSLHLIFDDSLKLVGKIGHFSEYPHHALFSHDSDLVALNSCHFYHGVTIGVATSALPGIETEPYEESSDITVLEEGARVYAGVSRDDEFIIGDASGYLRAFTKTGKPKWLHFIGSSIGDIDIAGDGKTLICSTYAGFISILDLDKGNMESYEIGTGEHHERMRWLFWKNERTPLVW